MVLLAGWTLIIAGCRPAKPAGSADEPLIVVVAAPSDPAPDEVMPAAAVAAALEDSAARHKDTASASKSARAAPPSAAVKKAARAAYIEAKKRFSAGDYDGALTFFRQADSLYPGAAPKHQAALCLDKLGRLREAIIAYEDFISFNPSDKYRDRVVAAHKRIAEIRAGLP